jgi:hypothetical protein
VLKGDENEWEIEGVESVEGVEGVEGVGGLSWAKVTAP